jgi:hypothetical protein
MSFAFVRRLHQNLMADSKLTGCPLFERIKAAGGSPCQDATGLRGKGAGPAASKKLAPWADCSSGSDASARGMRLKKRILEKTHPIVFLD